MANIFEQLRRPHDLRFPSEPPIPRVNARPFPLERSASRLNRTGRTLAGFVRETSALILCKIGRQMPHGVAGVWVQGLFWREA